MKKFLILSVISFCSLSVVYTQTNIKLSNRVSFYSSSSDITVNKVTDTTINYKNGVQLEKQYFQLNAPVSSIQNIGLRENNLISLYEIESKPESDESKVISSRDTDTLFFVLDQVYENSASRLLLNRESSTSLEEVTWVSETFAYKVLEPCTLNVVSVLRSGIGFDDVNLIFKENYVFTSKDTIFLSAFDAIHDIFFDPKNINGDPLSTSGYVNNKFDIFFPLQSGGYGLVTFTWLTSCTYKISDYHGVVPMIFGNILANHDSSSSNYLIEYPFQDSIVNDITFTNAPQDFAKLNTEFSYNVKRDSNVIGIGDFTKFINWNGHPMVLGWTSFSYQQANPSWNTTLYMDLSDSDDFGYCTKNVCDYFQVGNKIEYMDSPYFDEFDGLIAGTKYLEPEPDLHLFPFGDLAQFGKGYSYYWSRWDNNSSTISCETDNIGMFGEYFSENDNTDTFKISNSDGNIIAEGVGLYLLSYGLEPGIYTIEQKRLATQFNGYVGTSTLTSTLNTALEDNTPPHIIRIYLQNNSNNLKYEYRAGARVIIKFTASDFTSYNNWYVGSGFQPLEYSNTNVSLKLHDEDEWTDVSYSELINDTIIGTQYIAELTDYILSDSALYDVKIYVEDVSGNSTEHVFSPAFIYGDFMVGNSDDYNIIDSQKKIIIYPNPASDEVIITNKHQVVDFYEIRNMNGNLIKDGKVNKNTDLSKVDISDLSPGIYAITVYNESNTIQIVKIVKL